MIIDSHQHIWDPSRAEYSWLNEELEPINRAYLFEEFVPKMNSAGINFTILVQSADNPEDTELMLEAARIHPQIAGVVAYAPLEDSREVERILLESKKNQKIIGFRNLTHTYPDSKWLLREEVGESLAVLEKNSMTLDIVSETAAQLEVVPVLGERHPQLRMVIDHLSKPPIDQPLDSTDGRVWERNMISAAENPNVFAKISGLYPGADQLSWSATAIRPYILRALDIFGSQRLMYGGDWPISVLFGDYQRIWEGLNEVFSVLTNFERENILGKTAQDFYRLSGL